MLYTKIKMESSDYPKRFYRIIAVREDPDLYELGAILGLSVQAWFEHFYYFEDKNNTYVPDSWVEHDEVRMSDYHLSDLGDTFKYNYDTGEGWQFNCKIYKTKYEYVSEFDDYPISMVLEGKGQGIFENDIWTLDRYLDGIIPADSNEENLDEHMSLPMNMDFEVYGDFDKPLDLDFFEFYDEQVEDIAKHFKEEDEEYEVQQDDSIDDEEIIRFRSSVAALIFNDENVNNAYRRLIKNMDINDAYELLVQKIADFMTSLNPCDEDEFNKKFEKMLKKLS